MEKRIKDRKTLFLNQNNYLNLGSFFQCFDNNSNDPWLPKGKIKEGYVFEKTGIL